MNEPEWDDGRNSESKRIKSDLVAIAAHARETATLTGKIEAMKKRMAEEARTEERDRRESPGAAAARYRAILGRNV